jgi:hypothetical protein
MLTPQSYGSLGAQRGLLSVVADRGDHVVHLESAEFEDFAADALARFHCQPPGNCQAAGVIALLLHCPSVEAPTGRTTLPDSIGTG